MRKNRKIKRGIMHTFIIILALLMLLEVFSFMIPTKAFSIGRCYITCDPEDCSACESVTLTADYDCSSGDVVNRRWYKDGAVITGETGSSITLTTSGNYSVTVECIYNNHCHMEWEKNCEAVDVTVNPIPDCDIEGDTEICDGEITHLCAKPDGADSYSWTGPGFTSTDRCIDVGAEGTYTVTITKNGCQNDCSVDLIVDPCKEPECPTWTPPDGFTGTATLTLTITANDCESECDVDVTVYPLPDCEITVDPSYKIFEGETTELCANYIAGATYSWTGPGAFTSTDRCIEVGVEGIYEVTVTDENGCESTCSADPVIEKKPCKCSLVVQKRDEAGHPIDGAVFEVNGISKDYQRW